MQENNNVAPECRKTQKRPPQKSRTLRMMQMSMLAALSVVLVILIHFPLFPTASYLEYDMADVPVLLAAFVIGPGSGLIVLLLVSLIQAFLLGGNGIIGLIMHFFASSALILIASLVFRAGNRNTRSMILGLVAGSLAMAALMIPLNLIFTPILFGAPREYVAQLIVPVLIPFNLLKAGLNSLIFFLLYKSLRFVLHRHIAK